MSETIPESDNVPTIVVRPAQTIEPETGLPFTTTVPNQQIVQGPTEPETGLPLSVDPTRPVQQQGPTEPETGLPLRVVPSQTIDPETGLPVTGAPGTPGTPGTPGVDTETGLPVTMNPTQTPIAGQQQIANPLKLGSLIPNSASNDIRIRLSALDPSVYSRASGLLAILTTTNGMLFPYTPQIQFSQSVNYMDLSLVHSNTDYQAYTRTPSVTISLTGKFTVQSQTEGRYALACLHFLRTVSKSHFGENDPQAGLPPPVLMLNGYGNYMFNRLRCILKSHSWSFDESIDTISVIIGDKGIARLPAMFSITCELMVVQTPKRMRTKFTFDGFASGALMEQGDGGWI